MEIGNALAIKGVKRLMISEVIVVVIDMLLMFFVIYMLVPFILTRILGIGVVSRGKAEKQIALTFDDGPNPKYTPQLLMLLRKHDVKATFFVLGNKAEKYPQLIQQIYDEGHQIGIHNYTHRANWIMTPREVRREQTERSAAIIERITGSRPTCYRPPWGILNLGDLFVVRRSYRIILWTVMVRDWKQSTTSERLKRQLLSRIKPGAIVLLHDCGETLGADEEAPQHMLEGLQAAMLEIQLKGYECMRADELLAK